MGLPPDVTRSRVPIPALLVWRLQHRATTAVNGAGKPQRYPPQALGQTLHTCRLKLVT